MNIRILTDSASDFTLEELARLRVGLIPMPLHCGGKTYIDDKTIPVERFWEMLLAGETIKTSQPSVETFCAAFEDAKRAGDAVVCILIASKLSGTAQGAVLAKNMVRYEPVYIVEGGPAAAAAAEKMLVLQACRLRDEGRLTAAQMARELLAFRSRVRLFACIDTLDYLVRGGRLSAAAGQLGSLLHVKPLIDLTSEGEIHVHKKIVGGQHALREMTAQALAAQVDGDFPVIPIYAYDDANCRAFLEQIAQGGFSAPLEAPQQIGATIGAYIGPGGYGLVYVQKEP